MNPIRNPNCWGGGGRLNTIPVSSGHPTSIGIGGPPWKEGGLVSPTPGPRSTPGGILSVPHWEPRERIIHKHQKYILRLTV